MRRPRKSTGTSTVAFVLTLQARRGALTPSASSSCGSSGRGFLSQTMSESDQRAAYFWRRIAWRISGRGTTISAKLESPIRPALSEGCLSCQERTERYDMMWGGVVGCGMVWYGMGPRGTVWHSVARHGTRRYDNLLSCRGQARGKATTVHTK